MAKDLILNQDQLHKAYILEAVSEARSNGTPFGAVLVHGDAVYKAPNTGAKDGKIHHAEMNVLLQASPLNNDKRTILYTTCEPCVMCMGAAIWAQIDELYYGVTIEYAAQYLNQILIKGEEVQKRSFHDIKLYGGIERDACAELFIEFAQ